MNFIYTGKAIRDGKIKFVQHTVKVRVRIEEPSGFVEGPVHAVCDTNERWPWLMRVDKSTVPGYDGNPFYPEYGGDKYYWTGPQECEIVANHGPCPMEVMNDDN